MNEMEYLLLEKHRLNYKLIEKGSLAKLHRLWLENAIDRLIVKEVNVEVVEKGE